MINQFYSVWYSSDLLKLVCTEMSLCVCMHSDTFLYTKKRKKMRYISCTVLTLDLNGVVWHCLLHVARRSHVFYVCHKRLWGWNAPILLSQFPLVLWRLEARQLLSHKSLTWRTFILSFSVLLFAFAVISIELNERSKPKNVAYAALDKSVLHAWKKRN